MLLKPNKLFKALLSFTKSLKHKLLCCLKIYALFWNEEECILKNNTVIYIF